MHKDFIIEKFRFHYPMTCRLWHQLTLKLETFVKHPALQKGDNLIQLYVNFLSTFESK